MTDEKGVIVSSADDEESAPITAKGYNSVVAAANLVDVLLVSSTFKVEPGHFDEAIEKSFSYQLSDAKVTIDQERDRAQGAFTWVVQASHEEATTLQLKATFIALYSNIGSLESKAVVAFVRRLGTFTTYPYFRSHVSHLSWAAKAELPILPVLTEGSLTPSDGKAAAEH